MDGLARRLHRFHLWPALAGLSLALGTGLTAFDAGAHVVPRTAVPSVPLPSRLGSIDRLVDAAQRPDAADTDLLARLLAQPDTSLRPEAPDHPIRHPGRTPDPSAQEGEPPAGTDPQKTTERSASAQPPAPAPVADPATTARIEQGYGRLPMHFEPNQGQTDPAVRYLARGAGYSLFLTDAEAVLVLRKGAVGPASSRSEAAVGAGAPAPAPFSFQRSSVGMQSWPLQRPEPQRDAGASGLAPITPEHGSQSESAEPEGQGEAAVVRMRLTGATRNPAPAVAGLEPQPGISNYILGNDPAKWRSGVPHYAKVQFDQVYPGIDLVFYGNPQQLEYDLVVAPGADPGQIRLSFEGVDGMRIDGEGNLVLAVAGGEIVQQAPRVFQLVEGRERLVAGRYVLLDGDSSGGDVVVLATVGRGGFAGAGV